MTDLQLGQEWRPIATAPKDGTEILVGRFVKHCPFAKSGRVRVDRWHTREGGDGYEGWGMFNAQFWPATHWQPLPPIPSTERR